VSNVWGSPQKSTQSSAKCGGTIQEIDASEFVRYVFFMPTRRTSVATQGATALAPVLRSLIAEIKLLRNDLRSFVVPTERLEGDYAHPERIRRSYQKALRRYPPRS